MDIEIVVGYTRKGQIRNADIREELNNFICLIKFQNPDHSGNTAFCKWKTGEFRTLQHTAQ
jgi:hypothetical protein